MIWMKLKKTVGMFIPLLRNGQEKMVSVSVVEEDRIIYNLLICSNYMNKH